MTVSQLRRGRRLVALAILVTAGLLLLALAAIGPQLLRDAGARYSQPAYAPERPTYCSGEVLTFHYEVAPREPGPIEIVSSWRNATRATTLLDKTIIQHANVIEAVAPISASLSVTIPYSVQMQPGTDWQFVRSVRSMGTSKFSMFYVPFTIGDGCD